MRTLRITILALSAVSSVGVAASPARAQTLCEIGRTCAGSLSDPAPPSRPRPSRPAPDRTRPTLRIAGLALFAGPYIVHAALVSPLAGYQMRLLGDDEFEEGWEAFRWTGAVPLAGPWIQLAVIPETADRTAWAVWLTAVGLSQMVGATLQVLALVVPDDEAPADEASVALAPRVGPDLVGLDLVGRF
ncbi:MAG TPA: hypothetical protein RMH99_06155 [Sandaracinaceae bacterium LLY-WYZ-13_1]|nr:hypothetical protein [Sandaracinaceae bacterium LLY-WYZ-13_1]